MATFRFTLLGDGPSDRSLQPILVWVLNRVRPLAGHQFGIEFTIGPGSSTYSGLASKIDRAIRLYPCDILFVHRDAEREPAENRFLEISSAVNAIGGQAYCSVVPVRMTETWLLIDELAVRRAADNPNGMVALDLPSIKRLEQVANPKFTCDDLIIRASEKRGRRLNHIKRPSELAWRRTRLANLIADYSPLLELPAFRHFATSAEAACDRLLKA